MDIYSQSDKNVAKELGARIRALRLGQDITQKALAGAAMLSLNAIKALETGRGKLSTLIAVLRELKALDQLDQLLPEASISPLQLAKMQGRERQRASGERGKAKTKDQDDW